MSAKRSAWDRALGAFGLMRRPAIKASSYSGAATGRLNGDWNLTGQLSADSVLRPDVQVLRNRARDLVMNDSTASRIPTLFSENVIGKDGIIMQPRVQSTRNEADGAVKYNEAINRKIEAAWWTWYEAANASVDGRRSWCETETLIAETEPVDGEVLIRIVDGFDNPFGFSLDVLDADQLDLSYNRQAAEGRNEIRMGVEIDVWGRPLTYHILANHPSESRRSRRYVPIPAADIIHVFFQRRPKQTRGVTWFAPVITDLRNLSGYHEAELIAARTAAAKMGFLQQIPGTDAPSAIEPEDGEDHVRFDADPGVIEQLPNGMEFKGWDPSHPNSAFGEFVDAMLRRVSTNFRISHMAVSGNLNATSYGSGRIGLHAEQLVYETLQQRLIEKVHTRVYRRWLRASLLRGALQLDSYDATRYHAVAWHPREFPWIDPASEIDAAERECKMSINTVTRLAGKKGRDIEEILQEKKRERELFTKYGVPHPDEIIEAEIEQMKQPAAPNGAVGASGPKRVARA